MLDGSRSSIPLFSYIFIHFIHFIFNIPRIYFYNYFVLGKFSKMELGTVELNLPSLYMGSLEASGDLCSTMLPRDGCNCGIFMAACACPCPCPCIVGDIRFQIRWFHVWGRFCVLRQPHKELITRTAAHTAFASQYAVCFMYLFTRKSFTVHNSVHDNSTTRKWEIPPRTHNTIYSNFHFISHNDFFFATREIRLRAV